MSHGLTPFSKSPMTREELLHKAEPILRKSDESAYTLVPSEPSHFSTSTHSTNSLGNYRNSRLVYYPLSFENELFTARVYKRNYRHSLLHQLFKSKGATASLVREKNPSIASSDATNKPTNRPNRSLRSSVERRFDGRNPRLLSQDLLQYQTLHRPTSVLSDAQVRNSSILDDPAAVSEGETISRNNDAPGCPLLLTDWKTPSTVLIEACMGKSGLSVESILSTGCSVHTQQKASVMLKAIHVAAIHGQCEAVKALLNHGADIEEPTELANENSVYAGWRPLHFAVRRGDNFLTEFLLQRGAEVSAKSLHGHQPIHVWAATCDRLDILRILLENSANINAESADEKTPLQLAREYGKFEMTREIFNWGGEIDLEPLIKTILTAAILSCNTSTQQELFARTIEPDTRKRGNQATSLHLFTVTFDDSGPISSLDIEFLRLFLTFNPCEDARHQVSYSIVSRWRMQNRFRNGAEMLGLPWRNTPIFKLLQCSAENLQLRDLVATFDGTAQVYKENTVSIEEGSMQQEEEEIDTLCFSISREQHTTRMVAVLGDSCLQKHEVNPDMSS
ncbi:hypothetical protein MMC28_009902 [Mycoblastus sanguinarius]|nr:hypothetical protein [Mycoblastus sanguinarius]